VLTASINIIQYLGKLFCKNKQFLPVGIKKFRRKNRRKEKDFDIVFDPDEAYKDL